MGLINMILGNASEVDLNEIQKEFADILVEGEQLEKAFCVIRDKWVFTNKRLILLDVQGVTGSKRDYLTIPYKSIAYFSIETAGTLDDDCEMKIFAQNKHQRVAKTLSKSYPIIIA